MYLCFYPSVCLNMHTERNIHVHVQTDRRIHVHVLLYNCPLLLLNIHLHLLMLPRICAGSPKAMQQVDIVQSRMSLRCSRGKCNYVLAPSCAHSLLEKKVNIIFFYFQPLVYVHNQMYKCGLLITFENSSGPTKCSRENACMCRLVSAFAAREKMFCFFFSAHLCP